MPRLAVLALLAIAPPADAPAPTPLSPALRERCVNVLRDAIHSDEFWPAMHAAEALTLAGHGSKVLVALAGRIGNEYEATFARFHSEWLEEGAASLLFQLHQIGSGRRQLRRALGGPGSRRTRRRPGVPVAVRPIRRLAAGKVATRAAK